MLYITCVVLALWGKLQEQTCLSLLSAALFVPTTLSAVDVNEGLSSPFTPIPFFLFPYISPLNISLSLSAPTKFQTFFPLLFTSLTTTGMLHFLRTYCAIDLAFGIPTTGVIWCLCCVTVQLCTILISLVTVKGKGLFVN
ncbi:hypothetical protein CR513_18251, partial [Mucuna pruriens]